MLKQVFLFTVIIFLLTQSKMTLAQDELAKRKSHFNLEKGIALQGYDPVSYFDGKPTKGNTSIKHTHKGVAYYFVNQANADKFKSNPDKYEPAYGGWCAYAMGAKGEKVSIDPETYKITNGKLFLFYNKFFNNTLKEWNKDEINLGKKADENWSKIF
ncbi:YHS domain-containing (seleno)protein [Thermoflexibacter ruber]|uniref:YHS domain-containing protein n=1 Tax=Thermoflexibacter ruber TaxID=1003 RepID=A0A1I2DKV2_9BACT|nr:YHS domain-containing (seleno)protein [Thermoflexibacter ruber]SFE81077.1 YHS domain-containing protein [Thermoflexibacter ruber]